MSVTRERPMASQFSVARSGAITTTFPADRAGSQMGPDDHAPARNNASRRSVTGTMEIVRGAMPYLRSLVLAIVVTALILIGLPAVLALGAAAGT